MTASPSSRSIRRPKNRRRLREQAGRWRVSQRVDHPEPEKANELALLDLEGGADALTLVARKAPASRGFGVRIDSLDDLDRTLSGVMLDLIHLRLDAGEHGRQMAALLLALAERRGHKLSDLSLDLGLDPIGAMAAMGRMSASWDAVASRMGDTLAHLTARGFAGRAFLADGRVYHKAGASEAQELAAVLATGLGTLRALEARGHSLDAARGALSFLLVADADEFLNVAKLRALRRLWARIEQACGLEPKPIRLHAETAWRMTTRRDPWVNMLRTTVAGLLRRHRRGGRDHGAAVHGGARPARCLRPPHRAQHAADPARRIQPRPRGRSGGRGGRLRGAHGRLVREGLGAIPGDRTRGRNLESLKAGRLQARIAAVRSQREKAVATRREPITGMSEFPNIDEAQVAVLMPIPEPPASSDSLPACSPAAETSFSSLVQMAAQGATLPQLAGTASGLAPVSIAPLPSVRTAEPFERLRDHAGAASGTGLTLAVFPQWDCEATFT